MTGKSEEVQEVEAEVIDAPAKRTAIDALASEAAKKAATWPERFQAYMPESVEDYQQLKRDFTALNAERGEIVDERKRLLRPAKQAIKDAEASVKDSLDVADGILGGMRRYRDEWERQAVARKLHEVEEFYGDLAPDLVPLVPFDMLDAKFGKAQKWHAYGTNVQAIKDDVEGIVGQIAQNERLIDAQPYGDDDKARFKRLYFETLDFAGAARQAQKEKDDREALERLERERQERAAEQERIRQDAESQQQANAQSLAEAAGAPQDQQTANHPQQQATAATEVADKPKRFVFTGEGQANELNNLIAYCKAHNIHGKARWL